MFDTEKQTLSFCSLPSSGLSMQSQTAFSELGASGSCMNCSVRLFSRWMECRAQTADSLRLSSLYINLMQLDGAVLAGSSCNSNMAPTQRCEVLLTVNGDADCPILQTAPRRKMWGLNGSLNGRRCAARLLPHASTHHVLAVAMTCLLDTAVR